MSKSTMFIIVIGIVGKTRRYQGAFLDDIEEIIQAGGDASIKTWNRER